MLFNRTKGARDIGDHCKYDSESSGNWKRVQSRGSHLNPNPRTNKQVILRMLFLVATQGPLKVENGGHVTLKFRSTFKFC